MEGNESSTSEGPMFNELKNVMGFSKAWNFKDMLMVGRLCLLSMAIHGIHHGSRIPLPSAIRVLDLVGFEKYPWGRVAFESLIRSVKIVDFDKEGSYVIYGCVHALLIWVYESIHGLAETFGMRRPTLTGVPLLDWRSTRKNMYLQWSDAKEDKDVKLDNLIKDIIHNLLALDAWKDVQVFCIAKSKTKAIVASESITIKGKQVMEAESSKVENKKQKIVSKDKEVDKDEKNSFADILKVMKTLNETISDVGKNLSCKIDAMQTRFESQIVAFEIELKELKESSKVEEKPSSVDGLPSQRVVNKPKTLQKKIKVEGEVYNKKKAVGNGASRGVVKDDKKKSVLKQSKVPTLKGFKKPRKTTSNDDVQDVTDQVVAENLKMVSSSEDTFSDPQQQRNSKALSATLTAFVDKINQIDGDGITTHIAVALTMFRKRMMCDPSMYPNQQITFLDQDMIIPLSNSYSSPHMTTDKEMVEQSMFLMLMIPAMLSAVIPIQIRKKSFAKLEVKRITKKVLENKDLEIFDEAKDLAGPGKSDPRGKEFKIPHMEDS
ncbi:hypothetical protein ISN44_As02g006240 [Arabidopsis suecica]|uniref:DUF1985 domain-containing protein n=3 Tax=Arabidopsis TaxID=3701 RepID=A0A178VT96_ARATH|nr:hypothetical protein ISN44_As02g006240 [Arabidopsis suecica]OAP09024.1 hypothetical protein AXX17_AT2G06520 [Arabidopsis thaliana]